MRIKRILNGLLILLILTASINAGQVDRASQSAVVLDFPRLSFDRERITGVAVVNPNSEDARVRLTAFDVDGNISQGDRLNNPVTLTIEAGQQFADLAQSVWGVPDQENEIAWFRLESDVEGITGFFTVFNQSVTLVDGAGVPEASRNLIFSDIRIGEKQTTEINLVNPGVIHAAVEVNFYQNQNSSLRTLIIPPQGSRRFMAGSDFELGDSDDPLFVVVESSTPIIGFTVVSRGGDILGQNAIPVRKNSETLFFPQMAVLGSYRSQLRIVNLLQEPMTVTIDAYNEEGQLFSNEHLSQNSVYRQIPAGGLIREDVELLFGFQGKDTLTGWIRVTSNKPGIDGSLSYSVPTVSSLANVPALSRGLTAALFSHIATDFDYFTGIAVLNAGSSPTEVEIGAATPEGVVIGSTNFQLAAGKRVSRLINEMIPEVSSRMGGYMWVKSDLPVLTTSVFGQMKNGVLAHIPAQPAPVGFDQSGKKRDSESRKETDPDRAMQVLHLGTVSDSILGITLQAGSILHARQRPYVKEPGDVFLYPGTEHGVIQVRRNFKIIGTLAGKNNDILYTYDEFAGEKLDTAWAGKPTSYRVYSPDDPEFKSGVQPTQVFRKTRPVDWPDTLDWWTSWPQIHVLYLQLSKALKQGFHYRVEFSNDRIPAQTFLQDYRKNRSEAVHVSHIGFHPNDPSKLAFLSCWMGDGGGVDYSADTDFRLVDESGKIVFRGKPSLSKAGDSLTEDPYKRNYNKVDVYEIDFSSWSEEGIFKVCVEKIGCSFPFEISESAWIKAFKTIMSGFYHQRSGIELRAPYTTFERPRPFHPDDGVAIYHSTTPLMDSGNGLNNEDSNFGNLVAGKTDEVVPNAWGGYFDAGDWDRRIQHLRVPRYLLELAEIVPQFVESLKLKIPESADGLPDVLNEALWAIDHHRRMQTDDGGIRGGVESAEHPRRGEASWQESLPIMAYAPGMWSSFEYAGLAARAAKMLNDIDPELAAVYRSSAVRAMEWGNQEYAEADQVNLPREVYDSRNLAAAELYRLTGESKWHDLFLATTVFTDPSRPLAQWQSHNQRDAAFVYARTQHHSIDAAVRKNAIEAIKREANSSVSSGNATAFRWTKADPWEPVGWGKLGAPQAVNLVRAYILSGENHYFEAALESCFESAGANPVNMAYTTGVGFNPPRYPLVVDMKIMGVPPPPGINVYGPFDLERPENANYWTFDRINHTLSGEPPAIYPPHTEWPSIEAYFDVYLLPAMTEFTVMQTMALTAYVWGFLAGR